MLARRSGLFCLATRNPSSTSSRLLKKSNFTTKYLPFWLSILFSPREIPVASARGLVDDERDIKRLQNGWTAREEDCGRAVREVAMVKTKSAKRKPPLASVEEASEVKATRSRLMCGLSFDSNG